MIKFSFLFLIIFIFVYYVSCNLPPGVNKLHPENQQITAIFITCCQRHYMLPQTLTSFFQKNKYPIKQTIVILDGYINHKLLQALEQFDNITVLITGLKEGQLRSIDQALLLVQTPYVYYSEDDWRMERQGLIQQNINNLKQEPKLIQMWNAQVGVKVDQNNIVDPSAFMWAGFSLNPSVWRLSDIDKMPGGKFSVTSRDLSFGSGAGQGEIKIVQFFRQNGYYVKLSKNPYFYHLGFQKGTLKEYSSSWNFWRLCIFDF